MSAGSCPLSTPTDVIPSHLDWRFRFHSGGFHARIATAIAARVFQNNELGLIPDSAWHVLGMEEMEAIRNVLLFMRDEANAPDANPSYLPWYETLPEIVRQWVDA